MMLDNVKTLLGIPLTNTDKDGLLNLYINKASNQVKTYCNITELTPAIESIVEDLVILRYNRRGSEGVQSETIGDRSKTYYASGEDIPESVKAQLNGFRRMKVL